MHRYHRRAVSLTLLFELVDSAASYKRSRSLLRIFLSKLRKHDLEDNRISLSTVGSKQSFLTEAFDRVEHRYESGTASESAKRAHVFASLYSSVHSSVSFGSSGLLMTAPKHFEAFAVEPVRFKVRRRCDNCISLEWSLPCLLCSLQRMHDGWTKLISKSNLRWKRPHSNVRKKRISNSHGFDGTAACEDFLRRNAWRNFRGFRHRVWPTFEPPQRSRTTLEDLQQLRQSSQFVCGAVCGARCNLQHGGWLKLNLNFTRSRESFATARSENRFWGEKLSPWSGQSAG